MKSYLPKIIITALFSSIVMFFYYRVYSFHTLGFSGTGLYISIIGFIYICYKLFYTLLGYKEIVFTPFKIFCWFLVHLFVLCSLFFVFNNTPASSGIILFSKILFFISIISLLHLIFYSFGSKVLGFYKQFKKEDTIFQVLLSMGIGFFCFTFLLTILGFLGLYNTISTIILLGLFATFSYKELIKSFQFLWSHKISFKNHNFGSSKISEKIHPFLLSTEFLFIIVTGLISINFISVFRPFPIGWDDLGLYMNYPKLIAQAGEIIPLGLMMPWQLFTGIGHLFGSQTFAFFINSFSGVLAGIGTYLFLYSFITKQTDKKTYINIPLLGTTILLAMPMAIFQVAKDMKLDIALLFYSLIPLYALYYIFSRKDSHFHSNLFYIFIIGVLAGFTFSIKVTSLLFILGVLGVLIFVHLRFIGFLGYMAVFFAVFTKLGLWEVMNVAYPKDNLSLINNFSLASLCIGIGFILYACFKKPDMFIGFSKKLAIFILGIFLSLSPWLVKNFSQLDMGNIQIMQIIGGTTEKFKPDYTKIYSSEELKKIENENASERIESSGTTSNEDFGRYFGYEQGINNYIKLPWNLTMQTNQKGEFTDITYIFLALLPALLLFLPYRLKYAYMAIIGLLILELCLFLKLPSAELFTSMFARINLPLGYGFILGMFLIPFIFFKATLKHDKPLIRLFLINLVFMILYVFLWNISSFGVVWYGIVMYLCFILMISISLYFISSYKPEKEDPKKMIGGLVIFFIVSFYFIFSNIPHMMQNLKQAGYASYKLGAVNEDESIFLSHPDYVSILFNLNIKDSEQKKMFDTYKSEMQSILSSGQYNPSFTRVLDSTNDIGSLVRFFVDVQKVESTSVADIELKKKIKYLNRELSHEIIYPTDENKNQVGVYRAGTFLKYFISENNKRLLEDSLINKFDTYIYDEDVDTAIGRMQSIGLGYMLVDLNAATIDNDPRRALTNRYEKLVSTFVSNKLSLIETDSMCLRVALEKYSKDNNLSDYLMLATTNHNSYASDVVISKSEKMISCLGYVVDLVKEKKITNDSYPYLMGLYSQFETNKIDINDEKTSMMFLQRFITPGFKVLFKIQ